MRSNSSIFVTLRFHVQWTMVIVAPISYLISNVHIAVMRFLTATPLEPKAQGKSGVWKLVIWLRKRTMIWYTTLIGINMFSQNILLQLKQTISLVEKLHPSWSIKNQYKNHNCSIKNETQKIIIMDGHQIVSISKLNWQLAQKFWYRPKHLPIRWKKKRRWCSTTISYQSLIQWSLFSCVDISRVTCPYLTYCVTF